MLFQQAVRSGLIKADLLLAVPRSVSSALGRALSVSPDYHHYLFQPYLWFSDPLLALGRNFKLAEKTEITDPKRIIIKDTTYSLKGRELNEAFDHCDNICLLVRDPQSQALSIFRALNKLPAGKNASKAELDRLKRASSGDFFGAISLPWQALRRRVGPLCLNLPECSWCALDGDLARLMPDTAIRHICQRWGIKYVPEMVDGWGQSQNKTIGMHGNEYSHWVGRVRRSTGIKTPTVMTPRLENFSAHIREQVEANLRTYVHILATAPGILPDHEEIRHLMQSRDFHLKCPVTCYTWSALCSDSGQRQSLLRDIHAQVPEYESSYRIIDGSAAALRRKHPVRVRVGMNAIAA